MSGTSLSASNVPELEPKTIEMGGSSFISSVIFLADGSYIVGGGFEGKLRRWRADDGQEVGEPMNVGDSILSVTASRDGRWIVNGTESGQVIVWDAENHSKVKQFEGHPFFQPVEVVDVSPDGTKIATGSHDLTACVWSFSTGERVLGPLHHDYALAVVKYSHDGRLLATATCERRSIRIYDSQDGHLFVDIPVEVDVVDRSLAWSDNNKYLFALSDGSIKRLDVSTGIILSQWLIHSSTDPKGITLATNGRFIAAAADTTVSFWDTTTEKQIGPVIEHADVLFSMAISPNYDLVTSGVKSIVLRRSLREILPSHYCDNIHNEPDIPHIEEEPTNLEEIVKLLLTEVRNLRAQHESSYNKIAKLEDTIKELRCELAESQHKANREMNNLSMAIESLHSDLENGTRTQVCSSSHAAPAFW